MAAPTSRAALQIAGRAAWASVTPDRSRATSEIRAMSSVCSRIARSARLRSEMSRTNALNTQRSPSRRGATVSSTGNSSPPLRSPTNSIGRSTSELRPVSGKPESSCWKPACSRAGSSVSARDRPKTSAAAKPVICSARGLKATTRPCSSMATKPSFAVSMIARVRRSASRRPSARAAASAARARTWSTRLDTSRPATAIVPIVSAQRAAGPEELGPSHRTSP